MKKKVTQTTNQTQTNAPPTWTLPGLTTAGNMVTQQLQNTAPGTPYSGGFVAQSDPLRTAAQVDAYDVAAGKAGELAAFTQQQLGDLFAPRDNQALLTAAINSAMHPAFQNLTENILPGITNSALASGAYSNDRALGVLPGMAIRDATESAQRIGADLGYQGFQAEEDRRLARAGMLPDLTNLVAQLYSGQGDLIGAGTGVQTAAGQAAIDDAMARHNYSVTAPYERIAPAAQLLAQLSGNWGTQSLQGKTTSVEKGNTLGQILQGAMGVGSMLGGLGVFGPLGAAAGAATRAIPSAASIFSRAAMPSMMNPNSVYFGR